MNDVVIVGAGLAGLFAANLAARRGATVTLVARGRGGLSLAHGCISLGESDWDSLPSQHPLRLAGKDRLASALAAFLEITSSQGIPYSGQADLTLHLPTAAGSVQSVHLAPITLAAGEVEVPVDTLIANFDGFRDFSASLVADGMRRHGARATVVDLPIPDAPGSRDWYSTDWAMRFDDRWPAAEVARRWAPLLKGANRLGLPAILGLRKTTAASELQDLLALPLFEIPTLPPSLPGLRLERLLRRAALASGCRILEGSAAIGRIDGRHAAGRALGVVAATPAGPRPVDAGQVVLATGGALHRGWQAERSGRIHESVFDIPLPAASERDAWVGPSALGPQPYAAFGLSVNTSMQPCDASGRPYFDNVFACGGVLAGADRSRERNRQGIDLVTASAAVEAALA
ncbi:MAG TPA: anaerobic glycerol-3-phosphate dehydrogenase subunit B [Anaerolineales bacterium]|nr:anaerobic glycerol-3-phosphate dehydrogenase subunit B [Anaerolineales bacterium]